MRRFAFFWKFALLGWLVFPLFFFHPAFRLTEVENEAVSVEMRPVLAAVAEVLEEEPGLMADDWGAFYPASGSVLVSLFLGNEDVARNLNQAIEALRVGKASRALTMLLRYYNGYSRSSWPNGPVMADHVPDDEMERILYALYRYNRAVALTALAETNSGPGNRGTDLLRRAFFDLRRTVYAVERLGSVRDHEGSYWGLGVHAWEGHRLQAEHGDLPIYHVYSNLATLYLRIGDASGYPPTDLDYLRGEWRKYSYGDDDRLSPIMNALVRACLDGGERTPRRLFRLTMALHNMEAASRGLTGTAGEGRFTYTIGVLMTRLADYEQSGVTLDDAARYLLLARTQTPNDRPVHQLAGKELALIWIRQERLGEAMELIGTTEAGALEDAIRGPHREVARCFVDLLQLEHLAVGDLDRVMSHLDRRSRELGDETAIALQRRIVRALGRTYFRGLTRRLHTRPAKAGAVLQSLESNVRLEAHPVFYDTMREETRALRRNPLVMAQTWFRANPDTHRLIRLIGVAAFLLFLGYHYWFYRCHRSQAHRALNSEYGTEIA